MAARFVEFKLSSEIPEFGECEPGAQYVDRPGAYAFLHNKHRELAVIQTSWGLFLPGGGIDPGESELEGLKRELFEEMGIKVQSAELVCQACQYLFSRHYQKHFKKIGYFYVVEVAQPVLLKMEAEHELFWMDKRQAALELSEEFQRWALEKI